MSIYYFGFQTQNFRHLYRAEKKTFLLAAGANHSVKLKYDRSLKTIVVYVAFVFNIFLCHRIKEKADECMSRLLTIKGDLQFSIRGDEKYFFKIKYTNKQALADSHTNLHLS